MKVCEKGNKVAKISDKSGKSTHMCDEKDKCELRKSNKYNTKNYIKGIITKKIYC